LLNVPFERDRMDQLLRTLPLDDYFLKITKDNILSCLFD
jgi:hypothetical protein